MNNKELSNKIVMIFILLLPIIDLITSIFIWNDINFSLGIVLKGVFLLYAIAYLLKNYKNKKVFIPLILYGMIYFLYLFRYQQSSIISEIINIIKIFYLPILILFFSNYDNKYITRKTMVIIFFTYLLLYLVPFFLGIGHNAHEIAPGRELYLSYFYLGNEIVNVFILLLPITITYLIASNSYLLKGIFSFLILILIILMGTKAFYLSIISIIFYFIIINRKKIIPIIKRNYLKTLVSVLVILTAIVAYIPRLDFTKSFKNTLNYFEVNSITEIFTAQNIDCVLFNCRLTYLDNINDAYQNGTSLEKLLGLGREKIANIKEIEIDPFDIFYSIGIIGTLFYVGFFIFVLKNSKLKKDYKFSFILLLIVSCFTGHVLISPFVSSILALLFIAYKSEDNIEEKNILLVSNMYPSKQWPHYGIFVKNTYTLLKDEGYLVDLIVIPKTSNKLKKLCLYIKFIVISFIKALCNNYDYIYVHFISHSSFGIFLPYLTSKNTKLVLNVHGNDVIPDTEVDKKNVKRSRMFLKHADVVISPSKYFESELIKNYELDKKKIVVYPAGGVDIDKFKKIPKTKALKQAKLNSKYKYFGYIARIEKDKGYDILLKAINELKQDKKLNNIKFLIVGSGSEENILEELISKYKLKSYIVRKPLVNQDELVNIYNSLEAFIYPTRRKSESLGLTGLEAMACETLVIGSNKFGPNDYLKGNENSITFDPENYQELAKKIEEVLKMKAKDKNKLTAAAREKSKEYSYQNTKDIILKVFKK